MKKIMVTLPYIGIPKSTLLGVVILDRQTILDVSKERRRYFSDSMVIHHDNGIFIYGSYELIGKGCSDEIKDYDKTKLIPSVDKSIIDKLKSYAISNKRRIIRIRRRGINTGKGYYFNIPNIADLPVIASVGV